MKMKYMFAAVLLCCACCTHAMEDDGKGNPYSNVLAGADGKFAEHRVGQMGGLGRGGPDDMVERLCDVLEEEISCYNYCCLPLRCLRIIGASLAALLRAEDRSGYDDWERVRFLLRDD